MARPPRDRIELGDEERRELERVARAEKLPFQEVQRARTVLYAAQGVADTEIAGRLDTSAGLVRAFATTICRTSPRGTAR